MMGPERDPKSEARWTAVEEAAELLQEHQFEEALRMLRDIIKSDPDNPYAYHFVGTALFELDRLEPARDAYRAAIRAAPEYLGSRVALSHVLRRLADPEGAAREARAALDKFPRDPEAIHALALAQAALGKRPEARQNLQRYLEAGPEYEAAEEVRTILELLGVGRDDEPLDVDDDD
jgi:predicted Zn-dependent protease